MSDPKSIARQLKIKTGATQRLMKDWKNYLQECVDNERKRDAMLADDAAGGWETRNAENLLRESERMRNDAQGRVSNALAELKTLIEGAKTHCEGSMPEIGAAEAVVNEAASIGEINVE